VKAQPRQDISGELRGQVIPYLIVIFLVAAAFIGVGLQQLAGLPAASRAPVAAEPLPPFTGP
jgi:hypothetical protein